MSDTVYAVASLVTIPDHSPASHVWRKIRRVFEVAGIELTGLPHISWHVAAAYDLEPVDAYLAQETGALSPFPMSVAGVGVFSGEDPVIYLPVTRTPGVTELHAKLWQNLGGFAAKVNANYDPQTWIPHITLTTAEACGDAICQVISELAYVSLYMDVVIDNLSIIYKDGMLGGGVHRTYSFGKEPA